MSPDGYLFSSKLRMRMILAILIILAIGACVEDLAHRLAIKISLDIAIPTEKKGSLKRHEFVIVDHH